MPALFFIALFSQLHSGMFLKWRCAILEKGSDVICDCSNRSLKFVPRNIPKNTTQLNLSGNSFHILQNNSFINLTKVRQLYIKSSEVSEIGSQAFNGLISLTQLDLSTNQLDYNSLPNTVFKYIPSLTDLNIGENDFTQYPESAFKYLQNLTSLTINGLNDSPFGFGFKELKKLNRLSFNPCILTKLLNDTFVVFRNSAVTAISLPCKIREIEEGALNPFTNSLAFVSIKWNLVIKISKLLYLLKPFEDKSITKIEFIANFQQGGETDVLLASTFSLIGLPCIKEVDLSRNQISTIQTNSIIQMKHKNCLKKLILAENAIGGEKSIIFEVALLGNLRWLDLSNQAQIKRHSKQTVKNLKSNTYIQENILQQENSSNTFSFILPSKLQHLDMWNFGGRNNDLANVNFTNGRNVEYVNVAGIKFKNCQGHFHGLPALGTLIVSEFNCSSLDLDMVKYFPKLTTLLFTNSYLGIGLNNDHTGRFLKNLKDLTDINFSNNQFKFLHRKMFKSQYKSLVSLDLSYNQLTEFPIKIEEFRKLKTLKLDNNNIPYFDNAEMKRLDRYVRRLGNPFHLFLKGNRFLCNCDSIEFIEWLHHTSVILDDQGDGYQCRFYDQTSKTTKYAYDKINFLRQHCESKMWLTISIILGVFFILILTASIISYKYRITIHYWYLTIRRRYRFYSQLEGANNAYRYDVFIAYCESDREWVIKALVNFLEKERNLRVCVHDRDFIGGKLIMDNIMDAISESRKTMIVVSCAFLQSTWCEFELEMARMRMFQDNRDLLVVVLLDKISPSQMPTCLMKIWDKVTCLEVGDDARYGHDLAYNNMFWKRLHETVVS